MPAIAPAMLSSSSSICLTSPNIFPRFHSQPHGWLRPPGPPNIVSKAKSRKTMPARLGWRVAQRAFSYQRSGALQVGNCMLTDKQRMHTGRHDVAKLQTIILAHSLLPLLLFPLLSGLSSLPLPLAHLLACSYFLSLAPLACDTISSRGHQWREIKAD